MLPAGGEATPMAYPQGGREVLVSVAAGHHFMATPEGDCVVAYAAASNAEGGLARRALSGGRRRHRLPASTASAIGTRRRGLHGRMRGALAMLLRVSLDVAFTRGSLVAGHLLALRRDPRVRRRPLRLRRRACTGRRGGAAKGIAHARQAPAARRSKEEANAVMARSERCSNDHGRQPPCRLRYQSATTSWPSLR